MLSIPLRLLRLAHILILSTIDCYSLDHYHAPMDIHTELLGLNYHKCEYLVNKYSWKKSPAEPEGQ